VLNVMAGGEDLKRLEQEIGRLGSRNQQSIH